MLVTSDKIFYHFVIISITSKSGFISLYTYNIAHRQQSSPSPGASGHGVLGASTGAEALQANLLSFHTIIL